MDVKSKNTEGVRAFLNSPRNVANGLYAVSLFSGAGLSDFGYGQAGFRFACQVELDPQRAKVGQANFPDSHWIVADVSNSSGIISEAFHTRCDHELDVMIATPPCQGMSSSNPSRGKCTQQKTKHSKKNKLLLGIIPLVEILHPKVIIAENVRAILNLHVTHKGKKSNLVSVLKLLLPNYQVFTGIVNMADYGVPQDRRRALIVAVRKDQPWLAKLNALGRLPWPRKTHALHPNVELMPWISSTQWIEEMDYESLDSISSSRATGNNPLHRVPSYKDDRYLQISEIPPNSGKSAYENDKCPSCGFRPIKVGLISCPFCGELMKNRPYIIENGKPRLIKGFHSSYRRMSAIHPFPTITTGSSHIGSDFKIHPSQNRVLSILECIDVQTIPRIYDWAEAFTGRNGGGYLVRQLVGESFPAYFTYLHGSVLTRLMREEDAVFDILAESAGNNEEGGEKSVT